MNVVRHGWLRGLGAPEAAYGPYEALDAARLRGEMLALAAVLATRLA